MRKLLTADFLRIKKEKFFWIGILSMLAAGVYFPVIRYLDMKQSGYINILDQGFFACAPFVCVLIAVFCSLFIGTEYSDGTMRNKMIVGQRRTSVYLGHLVASTAVSVLMCAAFCLPYLCIGIPLLGFFQADLRLILLISVTVLILAAALTSIFTLVSMLCQNKAVTAVACILLAFAFLLAGILLNAMLDAPKTHAMYTLDENNAPVLSEEPNPKYLEGTKREIVQTIYDICPGGQAIQCVSLEVKNPVRLPLYSIGIILVTTGLGSFFFARRDLK